MWKFLLFTVLLWGLFFTVMVLAGGKKARIQKRIDSIAEDTSYTEVEEIKGQSFGERVIIPMTEFIYNSISSFSTGSMKEKIEKKLRVIGKTGPRVAEQWMAIRLVPGTLLPLAIGLSMLRFDVPVLQAFSVSLLLILSIQICMNYYLIRKLRLRKDAIEKQLPDVLDIITVSVEAGLSFDGAVERVVQKSSNELSAELATTLKEMRMGKLRHQALRSLAERCDVADLTSWVAAMIQADELGVGIGNVLRIQSSKMREKRRFRAREKSMKAPIKILFPLIFFIFPSIFIVLLGPAVIHVIDVFKK